MATFEGSQDGKGLRVGIVCSRFNEFIVSALLDGAKRGLANHGVDESDIDIAPTPENEAYLRTKRDRMGHVFDGSDIATPKKGK